MVCCFSVRLPSVLVDRPQVMDSALNAYGFEVLSELGKGSFGTVFLGRFTQVDEKTTTLGLQ